MKKINFLLILISVAILGSGCAPQAIVVPKEMKEFIDKTTPADEYAFYVHQSSRVINFEDFRQRILMVYAPTYTPYNNGGSLTSAGVIGSSRMLICYPEQDCLDYLEKFPQVILLTERNAGFDQYNHLKEIQFKEG